MTLYNFNPGQKSWKMYANTLTSIAGDDLTITPEEGQDLVLEVSGNEGDILFKHDDNNILTMNSSTVTISPYTTVNNYLNVTGGARIEGQATLVASFNSNNDGLIVKSYLGSTGMDLSSGELIIHSTNDHNLIIDTQMDMSKNGIIDLSSVAFSNTANITTPDLGTLTISGDIDVLGDISNSGTVSLYNGQLTVGGGKVVAGAGNNNLVVDLSTGRVGINVLNPTEDLDIDGNIQLNSASTSKIVFYDSNDAHEHAEIDATDDGLTGGQLQFHTKINGDSVSEKLRINNVGAIGIGGGNYGLAGQFLKTNGSGSAVSWGTETDPVFTASPAGSITNGTGFLKNNGGTWSYDNNTYLTTYTDTTYTQGTGVSISPSNVISIDQTVGTFDSPSFNQLTLGSVGNNSGIINLTDTTNLGIDTVAQMKGILDGNNGGQLEFHTKVNDGSLTERMAIKQDGKMELYTNTSGLSILTEDKISQQGNIYNSISGTKDFTIDSYSQETTKGISFRTQGNQRMRIGFNGELGFGATNDTGLPNQILQSNGTSLPPSWVNPPAGGTYTAGTGVSISPSNVISIGQMVGPYFGGIIIDLFSSYDVALTISSISLLFAAILMIHPNRFSSNKFINTP